MLKSLAIGLVVGFTATAALAQALPAQAQEIPRPPGVWDSNAQFVGTLLSEGSVVLPNGVEVGFDPGGNFFGQDAFYFTSNDCSGTPYLLENSLPPQGAVIEKGMALFYPGRPAQITFGSWAPVNIAGVDCNKAPQVQWAGVATQAPLPKITPPLCVSATKIRCQ